MSREIEEILGSMYGCRRGITRTRARLAQAAIHGSVRLPGTDAEVAMVRPLRRLIRDAANAVAGHRAVAVATAGAAAIAVAVAAVCVCRVVCTLPAENR